MLKCTGVCERRRVDTHKGGERQEQHNNTERDEKKKRVDEWVDRKAVAYF